MDINDLREKVKNKLSKKRFNHTCGVEKVCTELAKTYGANVEEAKIAAILHDYMKETDIDTLKQICKDVEEIKGYENLNEILHGFAAGIVVEKEFNITNKDILNAIKYHTVGRKNMSLLEKIVYIGDAIEEGRDYPNVDIIRKNTFKNIDFGIITEVDRKIDYLKEKNGTIHINTIEMRDNLLENLNK